MRPGIPNQAVKEKRAGADIPEELNLLGVSAFCCGPCALGAPGTARGTKMDKRYRVFAYFLGALILGSILLDWLSGSIRIPETTRAEDTRALPPPSYGVAAPSMDQRSPSDTSAGYTPTYAPSYENPSLSEEESSSVHEASPSDQQSPAGIANSSDLQSPAPLPTVSSEGQDSPDRDQYTAAPKSSNSALRETLKKSKGR